MDKRALENKIVDVLKTCYDPEIPVDIYELGLIYEIKISDEGEADILMTLTSPNCPVAESLPRDVEDKVAFLKELTAVRVTITFEPTWTKDMMSEAARLELGML